MRHKIISFCMILWLALAMPMTAVAGGLDAGKTGSLTISLVEPVSGIPMAGAEISLYYVASVQGDSGGNLKYAYTEEFENCSAALDDPMLSVVLDAYVEGHTASVEKVITDAKGNAFFENLSQGLYLIKQTKVVEGFAVCETFLASVPDRSADVYEYHVKASPKSDVERLTNVTVKKVWNTDESTPVTDSVTVRLLRNGTVVETIVLNRENNWQAVLADMPESDSYSIEEVNVPTGFTATYAQKGYEFTVTNSSALIQTGQLTWPIPILAMAGLVLITVGTVLVRKAGRDNE